MSDVGHTSPSRASRLDGDYAPEIGHQMADVSNPAPDVRFAPNTGRSIAKR